MELPAFVTEQDFRQAENITAGFLALEGIQPTEEQVRLITQDILQISISHGGDCQEKTIRGFCAGYFSSKLYRARLENAAIPCE